MIEQDDIGKCIHCGHPTEKIEMPKERSISFLGFEFIVRRWKKEYLKECLDCIADLHNRRYKQAYYAGVENGYLEAINGDR